MKWYSAAMRIAVADDAFATLFLHAAKYPSCAVVGVLLGKGEERDTSISAAVPCFHHALTAPALETVMSVVERHAARQGVEIVGCYYGPASDKDAPPPPPVSKFIERIVTARPGNAALYLSGEQLSKPGAMPLLLLRREGERYIPDHGTRPVVSEAAVRAADALCLGGVTDDLVDWEEHLQDPAKDWRNPAVAAAVGQQQ